ncbi:MAG: phenylacetic acid degradation bifunctional protein PaaZ [Burkholderiales bacterium PBB5]|nr:MAG: phenylacetic acid degradation bifunctional protein PaaZ [Burkholderiales bacterium PBB5]
MTELLHNHLSGRWQAGNGTATPLFDPVLGDELVRVDATGLDLAAGFAFAREVGGAALRALTYRQRAALLAQVASLLQARRDDYYAIATANSGTVKNDSAVDIDGGLYTLGVYAKLGEGLGERLALADGEPARLAKDPLFQSQHILSPTRGVALLINAFNFPSWGLWEKAAPALLSGVPVIVKPATATAWLTQPADTAALIRGHDAVTRRSVRVNIEADSVNSALLLPGEGADSAAFGLLVKEVVREMTVKSGQKCTAIRRVLVPQALYGAVAEAVGARLAATSVGNPRSEGVRMGALVSRAQLGAVREGLAYLQQQAATLFDGSRVALVDADPAVACCVAPTLLGTGEPAGSDAADRVHDTEVFGPVATLVPYRDGDLGHALALIRRGQGSLVASVYGSEPAALAGAAQQLADSHGRVHVVSPDVAALHTGHGNVMPQSLHGGPGRAGGGEELGGARALGFYHRRSAVQASTSVLAGLAQPTI